MNCIVVFYFCYEHNFYIVEFIRGGCKGEGKKFLENICMQLPEEECISHPPSMNYSRCGEDEFDCGNGQCIPGLGLCDHKYQCLNGADELRW